MQRVNMDLPRDLWRRAGAEAALRGIQKRELVVMALERYLGEGISVTLDWEHEENPGWDSTGTIAESWSARHGKYTARIDRFRGEEGGGYAYTVEYMGNPVPGGENVDAESFEAAEAAALKLIEAL